MATLERLHLRCVECGHWKVGTFTKEQTAAWLRAHQRGTISLDASGPDRASICPHPCGGEF